MDFVGFAAVAPANEGPSCLRQVSERSGGSSRWLLIVAGVLVRPHLNLSANREDFGMMRKPKFLSNAKKDTETWPLQIREK